MSLDRELSIILMQRLFAKGLLNDADLDFIARNMETGKGRGISQIAEELEMSAESERRMTAQAVRAIPIGQAILDSPMPERGDVARRRKEMVVRTKMIEEKKE